MAVPSATDFHSIYHFPHVLLAHCLPSTGRIHVLLSCEQQYHTCSSLSKPMLDILYCWTSHLSFVNMCVRIRMDSFCVIVLQNVCIFGKHFDLSHFLFLHLLLGWMFSSQHSGEVGTAVWACATGCYWGREIWYAAACAHCIRTVGTSTEVAGSSRQRWSWTWATGYCTHCGWRQEGKLSMRSCWILCIDSNGS